MHKVLDGSIAGARICGTTRTASSLTVLDCQIWSWYCCLSILRQDHRTLTSGQCLLKSRGEASSPSWLDNQLVDIPGNALLEAGDGVISKWYSE